LGGLRLALLANAAIVAGSFLAAVRFARGSNVYVSVLGAISLALSSFALRPQTLVLPLFVALVWLLVKDARAPSRRVFWTIPLLVLWANLHGSVTLGVLLVLLAVAADAWPRRRPTGRTALLAVLAVASLFASPYALHLPGYYRTVLFNGEFAKYLPDWMPTALGPHTAAFYLLAFAAVFAIARAPGALTLFEKSAIVVLPSALPRISIRGSRAGIATAAVLALGALVVAASRPEAWFSRNYPTSAARVAAATAGTKSAVFANASFSDWLLLKEPSLRGRVAYDARFEVLPDGRLGDAAAVSIGRYDAERILRPFDVLVLSPGEAELRAKLASDGYWRRVDTNKKVVVLRRVSG
jgi:hypothetical protein